MTDDLDGALEDELGDVFDDAELSGDDGAPEALRILERARRILKDGTLMAAVGRLRAEQRRAVSAAEKEE